MQSIITKKLFHSNHQDGYFDLRSSSSLSMSPPLPLKELEPRKFLLHHHLETAHMRKSEEICQCDCHLAFSHPVLFCLAFSLAVPLSSMIPKALDKRHSVISIS